MSGTPDPLVTVSYSLTHAAAKITFSVMKSQSVNRMGIHRKRVCFTAAAATANNKYAAWKIADKINNVLF